MTLVASHCVITAAMSSILAWWLPFFFDPSAGAPGLLSPLFRSACFPGFFHFSECWNLLCPAVSPNSISMLDWAI